MAAPTSIAGTAVDSTAAAPIPAVSSTSLASAVPAIDTVPTASTASAASSLALPHLQLVLATTWVQVSRRVTSHAPEGAASSFRWVGPNGASALLQVAATGKPPTAGKLVKVRGHDAALVTSSDQITLHWSETGDYSVALHVRGLSESEVVALAEASVLVSDADWQVLMQRAKSVSPPSWDRILNDDW